MKVTPAPMSLEDAIHHCANCAESCGYAPHGEAAAALRAALPFIKAAEMHFAGELNYASVLAAYKAMKGET